MVSALKLKKSIFIVVGSLRAGGTERSAYSLAKMLTDSGHHVTLVALEAVNEFADLDSLHVTYLIQHEEKRSKFAEIPLVRSGYFLIKQLLGAARFRMLISKSHLRPHTIAYGATAAVWTHFVSMGIEVARYGFERNHPDSKVRGHGLLTTFFRPYIYKHGTSCLVQTVEQFEWIQENWQISPQVVSNHLCIPEVDNSQVERLIHERFAARRVIWIGRDNKQKNLPLLLDVVRVARSTGANLDFLIVGVDPSQKLSLQLIIEGATVVGRTEDVSEFLGSSSVLLSTSRFEGFPNVIIEALHLGLPICSTPSTSLLEEWCESEVVLIQRDSSPQGLVKDLEKHLQYYDEYSARALKCHNLSLKYSKDVSLEVWERLLERQSMT